MRQKVFFIVVALACCAISVELQSQQEQPVGIEHQPVERKILSFPRMRCMDLGWSPDGKHIAVSALFRDIQGLPEEFGTWLVREDGKDPKHVSPSFFSAWMPDGKRFVTSGSEMSIVDVASGANTLIYRSGDYRSVASPVAPSPDGQKIAFVQSRFRYDPWVSAVCIINTDGSDKYNLAVADIFTNALSWSPDGQAVAYVVRERVSTYGFYMMERPALWIAPLSEKERPFYIAYGEAGTSSPGHWWSSDSRRVVAFDAYRGETFTVDVRTCERKVLLEDRSTNYGPSRPPEFRFKKIDSTRNVPLGATLQVPPGYGVPLYDELSWSPDGKWIAFRWDAFRKSALHVISADGKKRARLTSTEGSIERYDWSPDSRRIAFVRDGDLWVADVPKVD